MIGDSLNGTYNISYDHRNLIVQLYYKRNVVENDRMYLRTFSEFYKYDDAGNRIKKVVMKYTGVASDPTVDDSGDAPPGWNYELIQHYVRDVTGNELAVYNDTTVVFWNVYGIDNAGRINYSDDSWNFYLKDHLGTPRVVIDQNGDIISAEDLDMWGYRMTERSFQSDTAFYKYTGKERDKGTGYDYFGARYYDSRIGRWGEVEPLLSKYLGLSPFVYSNNNPLRIIDIRGLDWYFVNEGDDKSSVRRVLMSGPDRYFFEHSEGNYSVIAQGKSANEYAEKKGIMGKSYFEANDAETINKYFEQNATYDSDDVVLDWMESGFIERFNSALPDSEDPRSNFTYARQESLGGRMDQKRFLSPSKLYFFDKKVHDYQEAGNIIWGATMNYLGFGMKVSRAIAHGGALYDQHRLDEMNEQYAIERGWKYFEKNLYKNFGRRE